jgi:hypothetical protein
MQITKQQRICSCFYDFFKNKNSKAEDEKYDEEKKTIHRVAGGSSQ